MNRPARSSDLDHTALCLVRLQRLHAGAYITVKLHRDVSDASVRSVVTGDIDEAIAEIRRFMQEFYDAPDLES